MNSPQDPLSLSDIIPFPLCPPPGIPPSAYSILNFDGFVRVWGVVGEVWVDADEGHLFGGDWRENLWVMSGALIKQKESIINSFGHYDPYSNSIWILIVLLLYIKSPPYFPPPPRVRTQS